MIGVGLDGRPVRIRERRARRATNAQAGDQNMAQFDQLPKWARHALNGENLSIKIKTGAISPYIAMGMITPDNIDAQLMANDLRLRAEADRGHS